jgi:Protein of unknown function (DUF3551)
MRTMLFAIAAVAAGAALHAIPAQAQNYPWCLKTGPGPGDCKYTSYEQCMATASGIGKYCQPNTWLLESNGAMSYGYGTPRAPRAGRGYYGPQY